MVVTIRPAMLDIDILISMSSNTCDTNVTDTPRKSGDETHVKIDDHIWYQRQCTQIADLYIMQARSP